MPTLEEIKARREARKAKLAEDRDAQAALDMERLDSLEQEKGDDAVRALELNGYEPGLPTMVIVRVPRPGEQKRYEHGVVREKKADEAARLLGRSCIIYPHPTDEKDTFDKVCERWPGILLSAGNLAAKMSQEEKEERGKG